MQNYQCVSPGRTPLVLLQVIIKYWKSSNVTITDHGLPLGPESSRMEKRSAQKQDGLMTWLRPWVRGGRKLYPTKPTGSLWGWPTYVPTAVVYRIRTQKLDQCYILNLNFR